MSKVRVGSKDIMVSHLNVIINPVKRWFSTDKPIIKEIPKNIKVHIVKDHIGNDVFIFSRWETYCK